MKKTTCDLSVPAYGENPLTRSRSFLAGGSRRSMTMPTHSFQGALVRDCGMKPLDSAEASASCSAEHSLERKSDADYG